MTRDRPIILLALAQIIVWAGMYYSFPALLLRWEQSLGWSKADLTAAITLAVLVSAAASPVTGRIIDRGKGPVLMTASAVLGGAALFSLAFVQQIYQFYVVWAAIGLAMAGSLYEPCFALITHARGEKAKQAIILVTLIAGFASSLSFPSAHSLAEAFGWRSTVQVFALAVILVGAPLMWFGASAVERAGRGRERLQSQPAVGPRAFLGTPQFWLLGFGFALAAVVHGVSLHHLLPILDERGVHPEVAVTAASFIGPMQVAGRLAMTAMESRVSNHGIAQACFLVMACSIVLLMGAASTPAMLVGFVVLFGGGYGIVSIIRPVIARDILGEANFGAKSGVLALIYLAGSALAPYLGSLLWSLGGYSLVLPLLVGLALVGFALYRSAHWLAGRRPVGHW